MSRDACGGRGDSSPAVGYCLRHEEKLLNQPWPELGGLPGCPWALKREERIITHVKIESISSGRWQSFKRCCAPIAQPASPCFSSQPQTRSCGAAGVRGASPPQCCPWHGQLPPRAAAHCSPVQSPRWLSGRLVGTASLLLAQLIVI